MAISLSRACATAPEVSRRAVRRPLGDRATVVASVALAVVLAWLAPVAGAGEPPRISPAGDAAAAGMVEVRSVAPDIQVEMRYAGSDNFTGAPVPGYEANRCYLLEPVARALARVQASFSERAVALPWGPLEQVRARLLPSRARASERTWTQAVAEWRTLVAAAPGKACQCRGPSPSRRATCR